jgi:hypothetical protein
MASRLCAVSEAISPGDCEPVLLMGHGFDLDPLCRFGVIVEYVSAYDGNFFGQRLHVCKYRLPVGRQRGWWRQLAEVHERCSVVARNFRCNRA